MRSPFHAMVADLAKNGSILSREDIERNRAREMRRERLDRARPLVTAEDYQNIVHERLQPTEALSLVQGWARVAFGPKRAVAAPPAAFLVLSGERGRGKTVACAWAIANEPGIFITGGELRRLHNSYDSHDKTLLHNLYRARLVALDDLGRGKAYDDEEDYAFGLFHARQVAGAFTLVTTNLDEATICARYGDYVGDRIKHQGYFATLTGDNLRRVG